MFLYLFLNILIKFINLNNYIQKRLKLYPYNIYMSLESVEINKSVTKLPPGVKIKSKKIPKRYEGSDVLSMLSDEQLSMIESDAIEQAKSNEDREKKQNYGK